jgi:hypothetical protein
MYFGQNFANPNGIQGKVQNAGKTQAESDDRRRAARMGGELRSHRACHLFSQDKYLNLSALAF